MSRDSKKNAVLLVEDSEEDIFFFKRALEKTGLTKKLILATDGKIAVSLLSDPAVLQQLEVIFLDLKLPMFSGFDVLRWVQHQTFEVPLRIIVLSGSSHSKDTKLAREMGAEGYLVKPITSDLLRSHLS